jgi:hypothetical protein
MKKTYIAATLLALLIAPASHAAWALVNNFEAADATANIGVGHSPLVADGGNGGISVIADPSNASNKVLQLDAGTFANGTDTNNVWFWINLPTTAAKATVYSRFAKSGQLVDAVWGTSPVAEPASYGDFSTALRVELDGIFDYRQGSEGYPEIIGSSSSISTWYDTWFVVDVATNTYDAWIKGGIYTGATKVVTGAVFRNQSTDPQNRFYARVTSGDLLNPKQVNPVMFDNIWVDAAGENISIPSVASGNAGDLSGGSVPAANGTGKLSNLSTNTTVGAAGLVAGFVVTQDDRRVLVRAVGPGLGAFNVTGFMADPALEIKNAAGVSMGTNDDWGSATNAADMKATFTALGAFALENTSKDAAIMVRLPKGVYTATVSGVGGSTGQAIVEVYTLE